eukprot:TRINITY_DN1479_c0_g2_i4.p1 TRINITY_DN1479_c0_g2~~TRINITY_DN1479_c0_g2_i4.p1  ORF type:complete len:322 (-),score=54.83 TRINITY_DN1479_c0_g2_i4:108-1073(-)
MSVAAAAAAVAASVPGDAEVAMPPSTAGGLDLRLVPAGCESLHPLVRNLYRKDMSTVQVNALAQARKEHSLLRSDLDAARDEIRSLARSLAQASASKDLLRSELDDKCEELAAATSSLQCQNRRLQFLESSALESLVRASCALSSPSALAAPMSAVDVSFRSFEMTQEKTLKDHLASVDAFFFATIESHAVDACGLKSEVDRLRSVVVGHAATINKLTIDLEECRRERSIALARAAAEVNAARREAAIELSTVSHKAREAALKSESRIVELSCRLHAAEGPAEYLPSALDDLRAALRALRLENDALKAELHERKRPRPQSQ